jgi:hypothetical protein
MRPSYLAKQHRYELSPTAETPRVSFGFVLLHRLLKSPARKQFQYLRENAAYFHWADSPVVELVLRRNPIQPIRGLSPFTRHHTLGFGH